MPAKPTPDLQRWIARSLKQDPPRAKSLVMTVFGDAIAPYGGSVWLGSLIALLAPLGISERLVRTAVYRLVDEGWLEASRSGRRSQYRLSAQAEQRFLRAHQRVYAPVAQTWDGRWTLVLADPDALARMPGVDLVLPDFTYLRENATVYGLARSSRSTPWPLRSSGAPWCGVPRKTSARSRRTHARRPACPAAHALRMTSPPRTAGMSQTAYSRSFAHGAAANTGSSPDQARPQTQKTTPNATPTRMIAVHFPNRTSRE